MDLIQVLAQHRFDTMNNYLQHKNRRRNMGKKQQQQQEEEDDDLGAVMERESEEEPKQKAKPVKKRQQQQEEEEEEEDLELPVVPNDDEEEEEEEKPKKKKAPKKVPEKEKEEEEAPVVQEKEKKKREKRVARAHGNRFARAPVYNTQLAKDRAKRREEQIKAGKAPLPVRRSKPGAKAKREGEFLRKTNGLYISTAVARRMMNEDLVYWIPIIQKEYAIIAARYRARGKPVPAYMNIPDADKWSISPGSVQLDRAAMQVNCEQHAELANDIRSEAKRVTMSGRDARFAVKMMGCDE